MHQSNYNQFNYNQPPPHQKPPRRQDPGIFEKIVGTDIAEKFRNPAFTTMALMITGGIFGLAIILSYPDKPQDVANIPVVLAERTPSKVAPDAAGGMEAPFQDSTVFSSLSGDVVDEEPPIENLFASEEPIERADVEALQQTEPAAGDEELPEETASLIERATGVKETPEETPKESTEASVNPDDILQKVEAPEKPEATATESESEPSQDSLEFVKSVLKQKDAKSSATESASVEPAAGFAITPGTHYVQLGSVKSAAGAASEWGKIQDKYPAELKDAKYRVERADLGERGVFYRIQAGPMSGESASDICDSIKQQSPGGCLVVK